MLNDKTEFLNIGDLPKTLLVLGNGFDLTCGVPSDYKKFLEYTLEKNSIIIVMSFKKKVIVIFLNILFLKLSDT